MAFLDFDPFSIASFDVFASDLVSVYEFYHADLFVFYGINVNLDRDHRNTIIVYV